MENIVKEWHTWLATNKRFSAHTLKAYEKDLRHFLSFIEKHQERNPDINMLEKFDIKDFRAWLAERKSKNYSMRSSARALAVIKNFFRWLDNEKNIKNTAVFSIRTPKIEKTLPKALPVLGASEAVEKIKTLAKDAWIGKRDTLLLLLLYGSGLRISEALSLKRGNIENKDAIIICGKGNKERMVPILPLISKYLLEYLAACPFPLTVNDILFVGQRGKPLDAAVFQARLRTLRRQLGLPESATPHAFRHSFATHLLSEGVDLRSIQQLLGHASLSTTQIYTKIDAGRLKEAYSKAHPRQ